MSALHLSTSHSSFDLSFMSSLHRTTSSRPSVPLPKTAQSKVKTPHTKGGRLDFEPSLLCPPETTGEERGARSEERETRRSEQRAGGTIRVLYLCVRALRLCVGVCECARVRCHELDVCVSLCSRDILLGLLGWAGRRQEGVGRQADVGTPLLFRMPSFLVCSCLPALSVSALCPSLPLSLFLFLSLSELACKFV